MQKIRGEQNKDPENQNSPHDNAPMLQFPTWTKKEKFEEDDNVVKPE